MEGVVEKKESKEGGSSMVRWENFLPKTSLRVLLVEADDSTRQIIGALLRKCNYKVATAPDGLKAWEVLKARPHNIDLILTEMELPAISGYALLTLIMEHDICKNIPVIMMSKYDSVNMVYKCMTRGAVDFLVKPIRINELRNLWQHVWRRQPSVSRVGHGAEDVSVAQEKLEATAENDATSDRSSGSKACAPVRDDCVKKGSDAQSSCGKQDLEAETSYTAEPEDDSHPKQGLSPVTEVTMQERLVFRHSGQNLSTPESAAADTAAYGGNSTLDRQQRLEQQSYSEKANRDIDIISNSPREAIDLIGAFDNHSKRLSNSNDGENRYDSSPQLDLSLMRRPLVGLENKIGNENQTLTRSNTSAFTRYITTKVTAASDNTAPENHSAAKDNFPQYGRKVMSVSVPVKLTADTELQSRDVSQQLFPISVCTRTTSPTANSTSPQMNSYHQFGADMISRHNFNLLDHSPRMSSSEPGCRQEQKRESSENPGRFCGTNQCTSSSLCDDTARHINGFEGGNEHNHGSHDLKRQRSLQREAALNKFRLKRKERCYEKKVRYESRKNLAEQRPRVKGQFVRQVPPDPPPTKSHYSGDSLAAELGS